MNNTTVFKDDYVMVYGIRDDMHGMRKCFNWAYERLYEDAYPISELPRYVYEQAAPMIRDDVPIESILVLVDMIMVHMSPQKRIFIEVVDFEEQEYINTLPRSQPIAVPI